ncbi:hypothetical protein [Ciceribacter lividus]|uniref:hypothetical protein n=1 Tax=Ciceribacter lividus TaxID=1197950 RepID=UPI001475AF4E|nr:hypothetical protein [Ciceribacter lividus]
MIIKNTPAIRAAVPSIPDLTSLIRQFPIAALREYRRFQLAFLAIKAWREQRNDGDLTQFCGRLRRKSRIWTIARRGSAAVLLFPAVQKRKAASTGGLSCHLRDVRQTMARILEH